MVLRTPHPPSRPHYAGGLDISYRESGGGKEQARPDHDDETNKYSGLVFCADSGFPNMVLAPGHIPCPPATITINLHAPNKKDGEACNGPLQRECVLDEIVLDGPAPGGRARRGNIPGKVRRLHWQASSPPNFSGRFRRQEKELAAMPEAEKRNWKCSSKSWYEDNVIGQHYNQSSSQMQSRQLHGRTEPYPNRWTFHRRELRSSRLRTNCERDGQLHLTRRSGYTDIRN